MKHKVSSRTKSKKPHFKKIKIYAKSVVNLDEVKLRLPSNYAWKALGWLTEDLKQFLSQTEYAELSLITRNRDFGAYVTLSKAWGPQSMASCDTHVSNLRAKYQLASLLKKFRFPTDRNTRLLAAKETFYAAEERCFRFNQYGWRKLSVASDDFMLGVNTYALAFIRKVIGDEVSHDLLVEWSRHGPGSTLDTQKGKVSNFYKFANWPYDCTSPAFPHAVRIIKSDERWLGALEDSYRERYNIPKHEILNQESFWSNVFNIVDANKITFVPKSALTERTIAIEPTLNLFLQLGVDGFIRRRLKRWHIDLDCQARNQELARVGSIKDSLTTIDLSAASDSISARLVEKLLPPQWHRYLSDLRSVSGWEGDNLVNYEKFSSMGNGYTFALESLLFTAIIYAVNKQLQAHKFSPQNFAVFGDDLIVPSDIADSVVLALENCGFTINHDKSFFRGPVRESCGADWFQGTNVRPVFFSEEPQYLPDLFVDINRLKRILELYYGLTNSTVVKNLCKFIPTKFKNLVGPYSDEDFGSYFHTNFIPNETRYKNWMWKFPRLVRIGVNAKVNKDFFFRKLMHNLKTSPPTPRWSSKTVESAGSRFIIQDRNLFRTV